jgi:glycine/D-amino acid oxidase-like deaminating enzyme
MRNGDVSFWFDQAPPVPTDSALTSDADADVVIVGAGYTGLWTAYYLAIARPELSIRILEERFVGYGASGRNGGWLTNTITGGHDAYAATHGRDSVARFQLALNDTVDEVIRVAGEESIDAEIRKGGSLLVARNAAQVARIEEHVAHAQRWPEEGIIRLGVDDTRGRVAVEGSLGGLWQPHCARIQPAKLVRGLGEAVRRLGVRIHEATRVTEIGPGIATTDRGIVRAPTIIRATEGFTANLAGLHRTWLPLNSSMIVTEPIPDDAWAEIGWNQFDTLEDLSHVYAYAQRTLDGRIAIGGRGKPYRFGSRTDSDGETATSTVSALSALLREWFPNTTGVPVAHTWSGVLGVPRNWRATVGLDRTTGLGWAGGYVGTGVAATNLAGRTLADLVLERDTDLTTLPWVNQKARRWELEPLRWIATHGLQAAYTLADRIEFAGLPRTSAIATIANAISGR